MVKPEKYKILFIAKNIPVPGIRPSKVIMSIAHEISTFCNVSFLYPNEFIPFGFQYLKKYKPFYNLKSWNCEGYDIAITQYPRIPYRKMAFWIWNKISNNNIAYYNKAGPFDLIHAHYLLPDGYLAYLYSRKFSLPYVITIRNADILFLKGLSKKNPDFKKASLVINKAQQILVLNLAYKIFIDDLFGISSLIIPHGIEKNAYFNDSPHAQSNKIIITTVSEAIKRKNIDWIINGFMNYSGNKSIELNIIGTGPLIDQLKKLSKNDNRVIFHGKTDRFNVLKILKYSDIFALPSFSETFGLVYLEAAATKNAIIGLKNEGVWGIFDNETEMLFCNNESHFQELFHKLINNHNLVSTLKTNAFKKALLLDWDNIVIKYKDVYNKAIDSFNANTTN